MSPQSRREYLTTIRHRYVTAARAAKARLLDEVCATTSEDCMGLKTMAWFTVDRVAWTGEHPCHDLAFHLVWSAVIKWGLA